jgi:hypothetical protein
MTYQDRTPSAGNPSDLNSIQALGRTPTNQTASQTTSLLKTDRPDRPDIDENAFGFMLASTLYNSSSPARDGPGSADPSSHGS